MCSSDLSPLPLKNSTTGRADISSSTANRAEPKKVTGIRFQMCLQHTLLQVIWHYKQQGHTMNKKCCVVISGAGISADSGIPTFRGAGGLWQGYNVNDVATPEAFARDPQLVLDFYNQRRRDLRKVHPNPAHYALSELETGYDVRIITQNVDDLHERAGSSSVLHLHGELTKVRSCKNENTIL